MCKWSTVRVLCRALFRNGSLCVALCVGFCRCGVRFDCYNGEGSPQNSEKEVVPVNREQTAIMKKIVKLLALTLACLTLVTLMAACRAVPVGGGGGNYDANGFLMDNLPDLDYEGEEVQVLCWSPEKPEFDVDIANQNVQDAVYFRNSTVEDRLGVDLVFTTETSSNHTDYINRVENNAKGSGTKYDILAGYSRSAGSLAIRGLFTDLKSIDDEVSNLDLSMPWWPASVEDTLDIDGKLYFVSGDCSTNLIYQMQLVYFNKTLLNQLKGGDATANLYQSVYDGTWTIDQMIELTQDVYSDRNSNGAQDVNDRYGICAVYYHIDSFYTGSNLRLVEKDDTDVLVISDDYGSLKTVRLVNKLGDWLTSNASWTTADTSSPTQSTPFDEGRAIFYPIRAQHIEGLTDIRWDVGVLPVPKYNENQVNYYTAVGNMFSLYGITSFGDTRGDLDATMGMLTAVLECWGSEGYRQTSPEIFETNMKVKYSEGADEAAMFDIVRNGITLDLGRVFAFELDYMSELPSRAACTDASWSTSYGQYKTSLNKKLATLVESIGSIY